jgi:hypothetical protein
MRRWLGSWSMVLGAALSAQQVVEDFSYPDGPVVPGWTVRSGSWQVRNGRMSIAWHGWLGLLFNHEVGFTLEIPNDPLLVGLGLHVSGVTWQDNPPAILRVANDHQLVI